LLQWQEIVVVLMMIVSGVGGYCGENKWLVAAPMAITDRSGVVVVVRITMVVKGVAVMVAMLLMTLPLGGKGAITATGANGATTAALCS
jgi:hypothetical protein